MLSFPTYYNIRIIYSTQCIFFLAPYLLLKYQHTCGIGLPTISVGKVKGFPSIATYSSENMLISGCIFMLGFAAQYKVLNFN